MFRERKIKLFRVWYTTELGFKLWVNIEAESEEQVRDIVELIKTSQINEIAEL